MKSDFANAKEELRRIGIRRVCSDFYAEPRRRGSAYFVKSPATRDRTASLALFTDTDRYCDFANGGHNGDIIGFVAYVRGCSQWDALKELKSHYGLADAGEKAGGTSHRIRIRQREEQEKEHRRKAFRAALLGETERLKSWLDICELALEKPLFEPFSELWAYCVNEIRKTEYRLDILTGADCKSYPRLKPYHGELPSDRYQWILDCLDVLHEGGAFAATEAEITELTAQRDFELARKPGQRRKCGVEW